jgi:6-pyruvoyltetrahydropterin/6-carboxytetrahydropterin synthase
MSLERAMRITATRRLQYAIGHRVFKHEGKCAVLHGHNFVFFLTAEAPALDVVGRVIDFGMLKALFGPWLEENWDHGFVLWSEDAEAIHAVSVVAGQKLYLLPYNPTAENLARFLLEFVGPKLLKGSPVRLTKIVVWETENGLAEASL